MRNCIYKKKGKGVPEDGRSNGGTERCGRGRFHPGRPQGWPEGEEKAGGGAVRGGGGRNASRMDTEEARVPALSGDGFLAGKETRTIPVPANRYTPLKENWIKIFTPILEHLGLQIPLP